MTRTVRDVAAGSDLLFEDRGSHELRGLPGLWQLYAAAIDGSGVSTAGQGARRQVSHVPRRAKRVGSLARTL